MTMMMTRKKKAPAWLMAMTSAAAGALLGCGGAARGKDDGERRATGASGAGSEWYEICFKGAALPARRASGAPWHSSGSDSSLGLLGGLVGLAVGYPELGFVLGSSFPELHDTRALGRGMAEA
jgi:hypothetical protein